MKRYLQEDRYVIDYKKYRDHFDQVPIAIENRVTRERHRELSRIDRDLPMVVIQTVRISSITAKAMHYLCFDKPEDPFRKKEFSVALPPLTRTLVDTLFNVVYVFDSVEDRLRWYLAAGWSGEIRELDRQTERYKGNPKWDEYLERRREVLEQYAQELQLTETEKKELKKKRRWPTPGRMLNKTDEKDKIRNEKRREFLSHIHYWHYSPLSWDSHVHSSALVRRGWVFLPRSDEEEKEEVLELYKAQSIIGGDTFFAAILSEMAVELELEYEKKRLVEVWKEIRQWPEAEDLIRLRYGELLNIE